MGADHFGGGCLVDKMEDLCCGIASSTRLQLLCFWWVKEDHRKVGCRCTWMARALSPTHQSCMWSCVKRESIIIDIGVASTEIQLPPFGWHSEHLHLLPPALSHVFSTKSGSQTSRASVAQLPSQLCVCQISSNGSRAQQEDDQHCGMLNHWR